MNDRNDDPLQIERQTAARLGVPRPKDLSTEELADALAARRELIESIGRGPLEEVLTWADRRIDDGWSTEELAARALQLKASHYGGLSQRALRALAALHNLKVSEADDADTLLEKLEHRGGFGGRVRRARRKALSYLIGKIVGETEQEVADQPRPAATDQVKRKGLVQGLSSYVRGSVDDYVADKLDEIERRLDLKLDEIDRRMDQWRRREVMHRLRIIRITLMATVVVAMLSLIYEIVKRLIG